MKLPRNDLKWCVQMYSKRYFWVDMKYNLWSEEYNLFYHFMSLWYCQRFKENVTHKSTQINTHAIKLLFSRLRHHIIKATLFKSVIMKKKQKNYKNRWQIFLLCNKILTPESEIKKTSTLNPNQFPGKTNNRNMSFKICT